MRLFALRVLVRCSWARGGSQAKQSQAMQCALLSCVSEIACLCCWMLRLPLLLLLIVVLRLISLMWLGCYDLHSLIIAKLTQRCAEQRAAEAQQP